MNTQVITVILVSLIVIIVVGAFAIYLGFKNRDSDGLLWGENYHATL